MGDALDSVASDSIDGEHEAVVRRLFRLMIWTVLFATALSSLLAPWRVTSGLLLGGALALLNFHYLRTSVAAVFTSERNRGWKRRAARYLLRYIVIIASLAIASWLEIASVAAVIIGLCSFVVAALIEASIQLYRAFVR